LTGVPEHRRSLARGPGYLAFPGGSRARAVRVYRPEGLSGALRELGLDRSRPVIVLVGGAGGLDDAGSARLRPLFVEGLAALAGELGACVVDGGTDVGVMRLMGEARAEAGGEFPLVGVAAAGTVALPGNSLPRPGAARLEPHHTHFVLVPGSEWGDESPWLSRVASALAGTSPSITVLVNGGETAREDASLSVASGRPVITVAGSGRAADALAGALGDGTSDGRAGELAASGLLRAVDLRAGPSSLVGTAKRLLFRKG
jgi:hypothetical protein